MCIKLALHNQCFHIGKYGNYRSRKCSHHNWIYGVIPLNYNLLISMQYSFIFQLSYTT